ncbi:MAG: DUF4097 domain-containing protein [Gammaproteobacteria bacterium]|nr:DUF4097 domain-containing protein [Gammaproteobacteria bacterium]
MPTGIDFIDFNNLTGGGGDDTFNFAVGSSIGATAIGGTIDGGGHITGDSANYSALVGSAVEVNLGGNSNGVVNVEAIVGNNSDSTLTGSNAITTWNINGPNDGTIEINGSVDVINFTNFTDLVGGDLDDTFVFATGGLVASVNGGAQVSQDAVDYSAVTTAVTVDLGDGSFTGIEVYTGNDTNSTLIADNGNNSWNINGINDGELNSIDFFDFSDLTGGSGDDTFTVAGGSLSGTASGGAGDDSATITLSGVETGGFEFDGGTENTTDSLLITGGNAGYQGQYNVSAGTEAFTYTNGANSFTVSYMLVESVIDDLTAASLTVNGTSGADTIELGAIAGPSTYFAVGSAAQVVSSGKSELIVNARQGSDTLVLVGNADFGATDLRIIAETINSSAGAITAATLTLQDLNAIFNSVNPNTINTTIDQLNLVNISPDLVINETDQLIIGQLLNIGTNLSINNTSGDIQASAVLNTNANLNLGAASGNILLENNLNRLSGDLTLSADSVTVNNSLDTELAVVTADNLNITSGGDIIEASGSTITVSASTTLATSGQDIILDGGATNHRFNNLTVSDAANVNLRDGFAGGLTVATVNVSGNANLEAAGGDLRIGSVNAGGDAVMTTPGAMIDNNGNSVNFVTPNLIIRAADGIGDVDAIETRVANLDAVNSNSGAVNFLHAGNVNLVALQNNIANGAINFESNGDINFNPGSVVAGVPLVNPGDLFMRTTEGSFLGVGVEDISMPDISAQNVVFFGRQGQFGEQDRPLVMRVPGDVFIDTQGFFDPIFIPPGPNSLITTGIDLSILASISSAFGDQLLEVESLGAIDPAIFTDLKNYSTEEVSILLPRDQLYEDDLEEEE